MTDKFQIPASFDGLSLHKDGGAGLRFTTNELSDEDILVLKRFYGKFGWIMFKENEIVEEEVPQEDADLEGKTHSQRMRSVLFVLFKQSQKNGTISPEMSFDLFYRQKMEGFLDHLKSKITP